VASDDSGVQLGLFDPINVTARASISIFIFS
jgi:hypothetical protein